MPGVLGLLQAVETLKLLLDIGEPLVGKMLHYDALSSQFTILKIKANPDCKYCGKNAAFEGYEDYAEICASTANA
jgi:molybdopterin/thiamine biosynthesis adenylyltransferase